MENFSNLKIDHKHFRHKNINFQKARQAKQNQR